MSDVFRNGKVHVQEHRCSTCIFRPGNLMSLEEGRVESMVAEADANESCIPCHQTIHRGGKEAVCKGYFDRNSSNTLRLARMMSVVEFVPLESA